MQLDFIMSSDNRAQLLNPLYNHKKICELLIQKGEASALRLFRKQSLSIETLDPHHIEEMRCIFLNSLNRCLYNYILFTWDISLSECCFENKALTHAFQNREVFLAAGEKIIHSYNSLLEDYSAGSVHIAKALDYIDKHLDEELTLSKVAQHIYISSCYLCKIFKPLTGQTFVRYVNNQRLLRAKKLLLSTELRVDTIAVDCGFKTASYFSTLFRKQNGISPSEYRTASGRISVSHAAGG